MGSLDIELPGNSDAQGSLQLFCEQFFFGGKQVLLMINKVWKSKFNMVQLFERVKDSY